MKTNKICFAVVLLISSTLTNAAVVASHCKKDEAVLFSCGVKAKVVSFCASPLKQPYTTIEYRYGKPGAVEMFYEASSASPLFFTSSNPLPRAQLETIWFTKGDTAYAVSECAGMHCGPNNGLVVFKGKKRIARNICNDGEVSRFEFPVDFLGDLSEIKSKTSIIVLKNSELNFDIDGE